MAEGSMVYFAAKNESELILVDFSRPEQPVWVGTATLPDVAITDAGLSQDYVTLLKRTNVYLFANRARLEGRVTDQNSLPIEGVSLALSNGETMLTGADGLYSFPDLHFGSYTVTPTLGNYVFTPPFAVLENFASGWQSFVMLAPQVSTTFEPGITTTLTYTDTQGLPTSFTFPAGLVSATTTATVTPTLAYPFFGMDFAGHAFELALQPGVETAQVMTFTAPVSVAIQYSLADTAVITDSLLLALYRQEGDAWVKSQDTCSVNPTPVPVEAGVFQAAICQTGRYALFGPTYGIALPLVFSGSDAVNEFPPP
jgi:hypothetical protein